jgi:hypothetical protein
MAAEFIEKILGMYAAGIGCEPALDQQAQIAVVDCFEACAIARMF